MKGRHRHYFWHEFCFAQIAWNHWYQMPLCFKDLIQFSWVTQSCLTLCDPMDYRTLSFPVHHQLPELAQTYVHRVSDAIQPSHPLSSMSPPNLNLPQHQSLLQWVSSSHQVAKILELQLQNQSFQWIFRTDPLGWTGLIFLQSKGVSRVFLQHHSTKASILQCSDFFMVQFSHPNMTTEKTIALTRWTFVGKVIFLLFNMLSRFVIVFLPRSKHLFISWLQSPSAVILEIFFFLELSYKTWHSWMVG